MVKVPRPYPEGRLYPYKENLRLSSFGKISIHGSSVSSSHSSDVEECFGCRVIDKLLNYRMFQMSYQQAIEHKKSCTILPAAKTKFSLLVKKFPLTFPLLRLRISRSSFASLLWFFASGSACSDSSENRQVLRPWREDEDIAHEPNDEKC